MIITIDEIGSATLSPCDRYRYNLTRCWGPGPAVAFICLNPSTADGTTDDKTIRRIRGFAKAWGYGAFVVANLYAYRATDPRELWKAADPVGPDNDHHLKLAAADCDLVVAAWGANARPDRIAAARALPGMGRLTALAMTRDGQPRHPLYLRGDLTPQPWTPPNGA